MHYFFPSSSWSWSLSSSSSLLSSSSAVQPWVGLDLLKQMSLATYILDIRPPITTTQFLCILLYLVNPYSDLFRVLIRIPLCIASSFRRGIRPALFPWGFVTNFFYGVGLLASRPTSKLEDLGVPSCLYHHQLTCLGWEALPVSYATASIGLGIMWPHKPHHYTKLRITSGGICFLDTYMIISNCTYLHANFREVPRLLPVYCISRSSIFIQLLSKVLLYFSCLTLLNHSSCVHTSLILLNAVLPLFDSLIMVPCGSKHVGTLGVIL